MAAAFWGLTQHPGRLSEGELGRDNDSGSFVEPADRMRQKRLFGQGERRKAQFVDEKAGC
jgi:hypothetical protein